MAVYLELIYLEHNTEDFELKFSSKPKKLCCMNCACVTTIDITPSDAHRPDVESYYQQ